MSTEYFNDQWRIPNNKNQSLVSNYSMDFDGITGLISVDNSDEALNPDYISISAWYYPTSIVVGSSIISSPNRGSGYHSYAIVLASNGNLIVILNNGSNFVTTFTSAGSLNLNQWNFVCMTYDGSNVTVTLNTLSQSVALTGALQYAVNPTGNIEIGRRNGTSIDLAGILDQVCIFNYGLSASQVATLYGGGTAVTNPMSLSPKPIYYAQLGDQSAYNGANYLVPNNSLQDYVFDFNGGNNFINLGVSPKPFDTTNLTSFSISFWIKPFNPLPTNSIIFDNRTTPFNFDGLALQVYNSQFYVYFNNVGTLVIDAVNNGFSLTDWNHITMTLDGSDPSSSGNATRFNFYINNVPVNGLSLNGNPLVVSSSPFTLMSRNGSASIPGKLSNFSTFNYPLTSLQVTEIYNNGSPNDISSLSPVGWWKLNAADTFDGTNWTITDYASSNDGTSVGMTSSNLVQSNLQQTSGYSPYALDFDGADDYIDCGNITALNNQSILCTSTWINYSGTPSTSSYIFLSGGSVGSNRFFIQLASSSKIRYITGATTKDTVIASINSGDWHHIVTVHNGTSLDVYLDSVKQAGSPFTVPVPNTDIGQQFKIGAYFNGAYNWNGKLSNTAIWNTVLSQSEITEIYNSGVPSNLNTFSGTAPVAWWQLGSNSSFNTNWTCLDEIGTNNGVSAGGMTNDDITNGVGYSANGLGTSSIDIKGDAPYSSANGISQGGMDVLDRTTDVPS